MCTLLIRPTSADFSLYKILVWTVVGGGLLVAAAGWYSTSQANARCREIAAKHGYENSYLSPGRNGPDHCVCEGAKRPDGTVDVSAREHFRMQ
jgi:hypothetical protein